MANTLRHISSRRATVLKIIDQVGGGMRRRQAKADAGEFRFFSACEFLLEEHSTGIAFELIPKSHSECVPKMVVLSRHFQERVEQGLNEIGSRKLGRGIGGGAADAWGCIGKAALDQ